MAEDIIAGSQIRSCHALLLVQGEPNRKKQAAVTGRPTSVDGTPSHRGAPCSPVLEVPSAQLTQAPSHWGDPAVSVAGRP